MNVLSLFDGMSCTRIALDRMGVPVESYYASEIDKFAQIVSENNYPDIIRMGDVTKWKEWDIDWSKIDLVVGGFPCQSWSLAGKRMGDRDPRGMLFWVLLDILKHIRSVNPDVKWLLENVKMGTNFEKYITYHLDHNLENVYKHHINSAKVSAQSRNRIYWTNIPGIEQPEDKGILLKDIRDTSFDDNNDKIKKIKDVKCLDHVRVNQSGAISIYKNRNGKVREVSCFGAIATNETKTAIIIKKCEPHIVVGDVNMNDLLETKIRPVSVIEAERMQTVPDNFTAGVSDRQRFMMLGNGFTVDVIVHILSYMLNPVKTNKLF